MSDITTTDDTATDDLAVRVADLEHDNKTLSEQMQLLSDALQRQVQSTIDLRRQYSQDIDAIGSALLEWTEEMDMVSEYDDFLVQINGNLSMKLDSRQREWTVTETYQLTRVITVTAVSADEAYDLVDSQASSLNDIEDNGWYVDSVDRINWEVDEA